MSELRAGVTPRPPALAGASVAGSAIPAALLTALPGLVFAAGFDHLAYGLGLLAGIVLAALLIAPRIAAAGAGTATSAVAQKFGPLAAGLVALVTVLVVLPLLAADLSIVATLAADGAGIGYLPALAGAAALIIVLALVAGETAGAVLSALAWLLLALSLLVPLALIAAKTQGLPVPLVFYGGVLKEITGLEEQLVEGALVDFDTFSAHLTPFARLTELDIFALVLTLALGTAALPHVASAMARNGSRPAPARLAGAWTAFFVMIVLAAVPALTAFAKREIYREIVAATPLASLPSWLETPLRSDFAAIHGISPRLLADVGDALRAGSADPDAISAALKAASPRAAARWQALDPATQTALADAAAKLPAGASGEAVWDRYREELPAMAAAAGNQGAALTQAALAMEPLALYLAIPGLAGFPGAVLALLIGAAVLTGLVTSAALVRSVARLVPSETDTARPNAKGAALALAVLGLAAAFAARQPTDLVPIVVTALGVAAAGLFPALSVGLSWRRATGAGVIAAILLGTGVTLYYVAGTKLYPAAFYATWSSLSNAGDTALEEWNALALDETDAGDEAARTAASAARDDLARGTATRQGLANWAGVDSASAAVFGAPLGLAALVLVSLLTRRRSG